MEKHEDEISSSKEKKDLRNSEILSRTSSGKSVISPSEVMLASDGDRDKVTSATDRSKVASDGDRSKVTSDSDNMTDIEQQNNSETFSNNTSDPVVVLSSGSCLKTNTQLSNNKNDGEGEELGNTVNTVTDQLAQVSVKSKNASTGHRANFTLRRAEVQSIDVDEEKVSLMHHTTVHYTDNYYS